MARQQNGNMPLRPIENQQINRKPTEILLQQLNEANARCADANRRCDDLFVLHQRQTEENHSHAQATREALAASNEALRLSRLESANMREALRVANQQIAILRQQNVNGNNPNPFVGGGAHLQNVNQNNVNANHAQYQHANGNNPNRDVDAQYQQGGHYYYYENPNGQNGNYPNGFQNHNG
uniref:Uncharacterized protein n=1 Tax=Meloidogyne javanica TaxID=6303 RepID=A0A915MBT0_MELJA